MAVVETVDLTKVYNGNVAVDKLNLQIEEGEVLGFLGPNGAGKTTTILMLLGLTEPTSGIARVGGFNCTREPLKVKRIAGYVPEKVGFYDYLTAAYNLDYVAALNGIAKDAASKRIKEALEVVGLGKVANKPVETFSKGMKQRLAIAELLVKTPKVVFLDEPTSGIDPEGVVQVLDLIKKIAREHNMTIVLSSHQLNQVQRVCRRVGIMLKGKMVVQGMIDQLGKQTLGGGRFMVSVKLTEVTSDIVEAVKKIKGVVNVERSGDSLLISCNEDMRPKIAKAIVDSDGLLVNMEIQSFALEDIYMKYFREG